MAKGRVITPEMRERERQRVRDMAILAEMTTCIHFNGIQHDECHAGVNYHNLLGNGVGCFRSIPCLGNNEKITCPKAQFLTKEQAIAAVDEGEAEFRIAMEVFGQVKQEVATMGLGIRKPGMGQMPCPKCKTGTIKYRVAGTNGHIHAKCSTEKCFIITE